jgi:hypothetical protein
MSKVKNHESLEVGKNSSLNAKIMKELLVLGGEGSGKTLLSRRLHGRHEKSHSI